MRTWVLLCALFAPSIIDAQMDLVGRTPARSSANINYGDPAIGATASIESLKYEANTKLMKELVKARVAYRHDDLLVAVGHVQKAIGVAPEFAAAHSDLGVYYTRLKRYDEAAQAFRKAVALDPAAAQFRLNLAAVLVVLGRGTEAESACRSLLAMDSKSPSASYLLALSLILQDKYTQETLASLRKAGQEFAGATDLTRKVEAQLQRASD